MNKIILISLIITLISCNNVQSKKIQNIEKPKIIKVEKIKNVVKINPNDFLKILNNYRKTFNLSQLVIDNELTKRACNHNNYMINKRKLSHDGFKEVRMKGYWSCMENVAAGPTTPEDVFIAWKNSPGHNKNMKKPELYLHGLCYTKPYWTSIGCRKDQFAPGEKGKKDKELWLKEMKSKHIIKPKYTFIKP